MRADREEPVYHISVVARLVECHPQTLRMYERLGLVAPGIVLDDAYEEKDHACLDNRDRSGLFITPHERQNA